jgi:hypothetical protein
MGMFDDLIPQASAPRRGGLFADLITSLPPEPMMTEAPELGDMLIQALSPPAQPDPLQRVIPPYAGVPMAPAPEVSPIPGEIYQPPADPMQAAIALSRKPEGPAVMTDVGAPFNPTADTFEGDWKAGMIQLGMVPEGMVAAGGAKQLQRAGDISEGIALARELGFDVPQADADEAAVRKDELVARGAKLVNEVMPDILQGNAEIAQIPINPAAKEAMGAETWGETFSATGKDPLGVARTFGVRSLPVSLPTMVAAVLGSAAGPGGAAAAAGLTSGGTEYSSRVTAGVEDALRSAGVDPANPQAVGAFLTANPGALEAMVADAAKAATIIGAFDALSGGATGALAKWASRGGIARQPAAIAGATAVDPAMGAAGEALAGGSPGDVLAEAIGGLAIGGPTEVGQAAVEALKPQARAATPPPATPAPPAIPAAPAPPATPASIGDMLIQALQQQEEEERAGPPPPPAPPSLPPEPPALPVLPPAPPVAEGARTPALVPPIDETAPPPPSIEVTQGEEQAIAAGKEPPLPQRKPLAYLLRKRNIRIDPTSADAAELRNAGITPHTHPGLFKKGGRGLDTIPTDDHPELRGIIPESGYYFDHQAMLDAIIDEAHGRTLPMADQQMAAQVRADWEAAQRVSDEETRPAPILGAVDTIVDPEQDMSTGEQRRQVVQAAVDETVTTFGLNLDPAEREAVIGHLERHGGSVEQAIEREMVRSILNAEAGSDVIDAFGDIPGFDLNDDVGDGARAGTEDTGRPIDEQPAEDGGEPGAGERGDDGGQAPASYTPDRRPAPVVWQAFDDAFSKGPDFPSVSFALGSDWGSGPALTAAQYRQRAEERMTSLYGPRPARTGTEEGGRVDLTPEGKQLVIPGAEQITDRERAERKQQEAKRGGSKPMDDDGLFGDPENRRDLFDEPKRTPTSELTDEERDERAEVRAEASAPVKAARQAKSKEMFEQGQAAAKAGEPKPSPKDLRAQGITHITDFSEWMRGYDNPTMPFGGPRDAADTDAEPAPKINTAQDIGDTTGRKPRGRLSPRFLNFSFTNRASVYGAAFRDAGIDPGEANNMPIEEQIRVLAKMLKDKFGINVQLPTIKVRKKNLVGRLVKKVRRDITPVEAVDQMLDAYRNLQMLAHIMQVPEKALALEINGEPITLSLQSVRSVGALGMFSWGPGQPRTIHLPGRSNSFAHEWGHALDNWLVQFAKREGMLSRQMDATGVQRQLNPQASVVEAFAGLMQALYGEKDKISALILELQSQAAQVGVDGKPTEGAKNAQRIMFNLRAGKRPPAELLNRYFKSSKEYDDQYSGGTGYFVDPAEMFARAFESWVGRTVSAISDLPQGFLSKGGWAYDSNVDERLKLTFPKDGDAVAFGQAMEELQNAMTRVSLFGRDPAAVQPEDVDIYSDKTLLLRLPKMGTMALTAAAEKAALREMVAAWKRFFNLRAKASTAGSMLYGLWTDYLNSLTASMHAAAYAQSNARATRAILNIADQIGSDPGSGRLAKRTYQQDMEVTAKRRLRMVDGALAKAGFRHDRMTDEQAKTLRSLLIGQKGVQTTQAMRTLASDLRQILKGIWYDLKNAGITLGYADSYLPRIPNKEEINTDPAAFRRDATKVYALMFQREVTENEDPDTQLLDMKTVIRGLRNATQPTPEGERNPAPRLDENDEELIQEWNAARAQLKRLQKQAEEDPLSTTIGDKIVAAEADYEDLHERLLNVLKDRFSVYSAEKWHTSMMVGDSNDFDTMGPTGSFLKGRILPQEADQILTRWLENDPLELISGYAFASARRAEFAKRFGAQGEKLENMLEAAVKAGATGYDVGLVRRAVNSATGRFRHPSRFGEQASSALTFWGTIAMLGRATFASLSEPVVTGLRSGDVRDSFRAVASQIRTLVSRGRQEDLFELARVIGLVTSAMRETVMANRIGADSAAMTKGMSATMAKFFQKSLLTPLTNFQMASSIPVAHAIIMRHLQTDAGKGRGKALANAELNELGIAKEDRPDLLAWLEGLKGLPTPEDMLAPDGSFYNAAADLWATASVRLINTVIQSPMKSDRPIMANHPMVASLYGIMSFTMAFHRNILVRNVRRIKNADGFGNAALHTGHAAMGVGVLLAGQLLTTVIREAIFNPEKWREKEDEDDLLKWLFQRAFARSGLTGMFDPLVQLFTGIKYERDLTSIAAGPYAAYFLYNLQRIISAWAGRNSPNTNTAENNAVRAGYQMIFQPGLMAGVANLLPGGPISGMASTAAIWWGSSPQAAATVAETLTGPKGEDYRAEGKDRPWWEIAPPKADDDED